MARKILIVDDSVVVRKHLRAILEASGYQVLEAVDGPEGLSVLRSEQEIAVVLCDVNMPCMSGLEMAEQAKAERSRVPIVMVTAEAVEGMVSRGAAAGVRAWIVKPFKPPVVLGAVKALAGPPA